MWRQVPLSITYAAYLWERRGNLTNDRVFLVPRLPTHITELICPFGDNLKYVSSQPRIYKTINSTISAAFSVNPLGLSLLCQLRAWYPEQFRNQRCRCATYTTLNKYTTMSVLCTLVILLLQLLTTTKVTIPTRRRQGASEWMQNRHSSSKGAALLPSYPSSAPWSTACITN